MNAPRPLLLLACALLLGPWTGNVQASPVTLEVENEGRDCSALAPGCFVTVDPHGDGIGDDEVNVTQNLRRVHLGLAGGGPVKQGVVLDMRDVRVDHGLMSASRNAWEGNGGSPAPGVINITINESGLHVHRPAAKPKELDRGVYSDTDRVGFNEGGIGYDRVGPYNDVGSNSTDGIIAQMSGFCYGAEREICEDVHGNASGLAAEQLPAVGVGGSLGEFSAGFGNGTTKENRTAGSVATAGRMPNRDLGEVRRREPLRASDQEPRPPSPQGAPSDAFILNRVESPPPAKPMAPTAEPSSGRAWVKLAAAGLLTALLLVAAGLYARLRQGKEILSSEKRQLVLEAVQGQPGVRVAALARDLKMGRTALMHHLAVLERASLVKTRREGHTVSVFPAGVQPPARFDLQLHPICQKVLRALAGSPEGLTRSELRDLAPDVAERTLNYNIRRLQDAGLIAARGAGRGARLVLNGPALA